MTYLGALSYHRQILLGWTQKSVPCLTGEGVGTEVPSGQFFNVRRRHLEFTYSGYQAYVHIMHTHTHARTHTHTPALLVGYTPTPSPPAYKTDHNHIMGTFQIIAKVAYLYTALLNCVTTAGSTLSSKLTLACVCVLIVHMHVA